MLDGRSVLFEWLISMTSLVRRSFVFSIFAAVLVMTGCVSGQGGSTESSVTPAPEAAVPEAPAVTGTVLVAGATGGTGSQIVKHLVINGFTVRAMVRDEARAREALSEYGDSIQYVVADVRKPDQLIEAMTGADFVITSIGGSRNDDSNSPEFVDYGGVRNLADVAAGLNIKQFVLVSSSGVTQEDHFLNKMFNNVLIWKLKGEDALRASGVPYTVVRPGGLVNKPGSLDKIVFAQGDTTAGTIAREDVARICVAALQYPEASGKTFETYSEQVEQGAISEQGTDWVSLFGKLKAD